MLASIFGYICLAIFVFVILSFLILHYSRKTNDLVWNLHLPIVGNFLMMLTNLHRRLLDFFTELLQINGGTIIIKGPPFSNLKLVFTSDPANVLHVTTTKFSMYPKGEYWKKRFDMFGSSIFNSDFEEWKFHRTYVQEFLSHQKFHLLPKVFEESMNKKLIPCLDHVCTTDVPVDFADLLKRHVLYISCRIITGCDLTSSIFPFSFHENLLLEAMSDAGEAIIVRHMLPESLWKLQKWLGIGLEGKLRDARMTIDNVVAEQISLKRKEMANRVVEKDIDFDALELQLNHDARIKLLRRNVSVSGQLIRDNIVSLFFAMETVGTVLVWFFWILSKHPIVEKRIRQEIQKHLGELKWITYDTKELKKLVYLHAACCETLRLFPPVPLDSRTSVQDDILPSGHKINQGQNIIRSAYAMGRMSSIWGEDCHEFKPERWISEDGEIKHVASHKFFAFIAGPRICPGKDIGFTLMKATASAIIHNYHIQVVENQVVTPKTSTFLHMKQGLMVKIKKRLPSP